MPIGKLVLIFINKTESKNTAAEASTPEHKHDTIQDKSSGVEVICSV